MVIKLEDRKPIIHFNFPAKALFLMCPFAKKPNTKLHILLLNWNQSKIWFAIRLSGLPWKNTLFESAFLYIHFFFSFWLIQEELQLSHKAYTEAIDMLGEISTNYSPMEKVEVLKRTFDKIHQVGFFSSFIKFD